MDKLTKYIDCYIPTETCNLQCHYCYIAQQKKFTNKLVKFDKSPKEIRQALSKERLGGTCFLNFCAGGETLLSHEVLDVAKEILAEGHYIMIVTNGTLTKKFDEIAEWPQEYKDRLMFKFSFHYLELIRLKMMDQFFSNIKKMDENGCSFTVEITPNDEIIPYIDEIKEICMNKLGTLCHVTIARDDRTKDIRHLSKYSFDEFLKIWGTFDSQLLDFKKTIFYKKRKEFCYAGCWSYYLNINSGDLQQCVYGNYLGNIYDDISAKLPSCPVGNNCEYPHCYNGHVFLTLGDIPEIKSPTYYSVRNRKDNKGSDWIKPKFANIMQQKLGDNNSEMDLLEKKKANRKNKKIALKTIVKKIKNKL